mmetsp:Transcript_344/g.834  ORF Transcript_344/g.834 Transcript_344/m.834 type:complete len:259 (+) Transcript_344:3-779(+)
MMRDKLALVARIAQDVIFSVLLGLIWLNQGRDVDSNNASFASLNAIIGVMFFIVVNVSFTGAFGVIFVYPLERAVLLRERASATYRVTSYVVGKTLAEIPRSVLFVLGFCVVVYFMIGLRSTAGAFFYFFVVIWLVENIAASLTLALATFAPDPQVSSAVVPVFIIFNMLFAGYFIGADSIPSFLRWIKWLSFLFYALQGLIHNEFNGTKAIDEVNDFLGLDVSQGMAVVALVVYLVVMKAFWYLALRVERPKFDKSL